MMVGVDSGMMGVPTQRCALLRSTHPTRVATTFNSSFAARCETAQGFGGAAGAAFGHAAHHLQLSLQLELERACGDALLYIQ